MKKEKGSDKKLIISQRRVYIEFMVNVLILLNGSLRSLL